MARINSARCKQCNLQNCSKTSLLHGQPPSQTNSRVTRRTAHQHQRCDGNAFHSSDSLRSCSFESFVSRAASCPDCHFQSFRNDMLVCWVLNSGCFTLALVLAIVSVGVSGFGSGGLSSSSPDRALNVPPVALLSAGSSANPGQRKGGPVTPSGGLLQVKQSFSDLDSAETSTDDITLDGDDSSPTAQKSPSDPDLNTPGGRSENTQDVECIPRKVPSVSSQPKKQMPKPSGGGSPIWSGLKGLGKRAKGKLMDIGLKREQPPRKSRGGPLQWLGRVGGKTSSPSMLQIPSQEDIDAREAAAAQEYTERINEAAARAQPRLEQAGRSGSSEALSSAVSTYYQTYAILHTYILTTSAKILLESLKATLVGAQGQVIVSTSDLYSSLLSSLPGALASARHYMDLVMNIIGEALTQISNNTGAADRYTAEVLMKLSDIEALVRHTASKKSDLTLTLDRPTSEIDAIIRSELEPAISGSLEPAMQLEIVERTLSIINSNSQASSQVTYHILGGAVGGGFPAPPGAAPGYAPRFGEPGAGGPPGAAPGYAFRFGQPAGEGFRGAAPGYAPQFGEPGAAGPRGPATGYVPRFGEPAAGGPPGAAPAPGYVPRFGEPGAEGGREVAPEAAPRFGGPGTEGFGGPSEGAPPQAPGRAPAPREGEGAVQPPAPDVVKTGMAEAEEAARQREQESIQELGRNLAQGSAQFRSAPAEYIWESQGTSSAACQTDFSLAVPTEEEKRSGLLPRSCGTRAAKAIETLVTRQLKKVQRPPLRLFATQFDIESYVKELWQAEKKKMMDDNSPAPSFYTLVSTGCSSTSRDLTRQFWTAWKDRELFRNVAANATQSERLRRRVEILVGNGELCYGERELARRRKERKRHHDCFHNRLFKHETCLLYVFIGILPFMTKDQDKRVGGSLNSVMTNFLHEQKLKGGKMPKSSRVLASFVFSADHTLMVLEAMLKRAVGYALSFMERSERQGQAQPGQTSASEMSRKDALNRSLEMFSSYKKLKKGTKDPFDFSMIRGMLNHLQVTSQFINVLAADKRTRHLIGLLIHSWVQARGVHAAAEGFKPGSSSKAPVKSTNLAAIFAKLWFESALMSGAEGHKLKPFGSPVVSAGLQIAFFLHTVAEEYEASLLKQMGAAIKSFFASIFKGSASASLPASWAVLQMRAMRQHKVKARQYEGVLSVISQLSTMFRKRFLESMYTTTQPEALKALYTVIQGLVGLWMTPVNETFDLTSSNISSAKKLFYLYTFFHPKGPSFVAARLIKEGCSASGDSVSLGVVVDVKDSNRRSVNGSDLRLKKKSLKLKREKALVASLNKLMATYTDPMAIVRGAMDLALRCRGGLRDPTGREYSDSASSFASVDTTETSNSHETEEPSLHSAEAPKASFDQLGDALSKKKGGKAKRDPWSEDQVLGSKLVVDSWCQVYKEKLLAEMAGFKSSKSSWEIQRQLDDVLESITEISISIREKAKDRIISFKCVWMSGHPNQEAMRAERNAMMAYAISSSSLEKRLARQLKGVKKFFKTKLRSIIRTQMTRPATSQYGLLHAGSEVWTGDFYMWPKAA
ncbi:hypothetical protein ACSSS7_002978 [Eimeria intestinalis]